MFQFKATRRQLSTQLRNRTTARGMCELAGICKFIVLGISLVSVWRTRSLKWVLGTITLTLFTTPRNRPPIKFKTLVNLLWNYLDWSLSWILTGVSELSDLEDFTSRDSLGDLINRRFRILLSTARPYLDRFEEFRASVVDNEEEVIGQLTQVCNCVRLWPINWVYRLIIFH